MTRSPLSRVHRLLSEKTISALAQFPGVISIYNLRPKGQDHTYGLSDLDLALVIDFSSGEKFQIFLALANTVRGIKKKFKLLDQKGIIIIDSRDFTRCEILNAGFYWPDGHPISSWQLVYGKELRTFPKERKVGLSPDSVLLSQHIYQAGPNWDRGVRKRSEKLALRFGSTPPATAYDAYQLLEISSPHIENLVGTHVIEGRKLTVVPTGLTELDFNQERIKWLNTKGPTDYFFGDKFFSSYLRDSADFMVHEPWLLAQSLGISSNELTPELRIKFISDVLTEKNECLFQHVLQGRIFERPRREEKWRKLMIYASILKTGRMPSALRSLPETESEYFSSLDSLLTELLGDHA